MNIQWDAIQWDAIGYVSGGFTLLAFFAAVSAWLYRYKLRYDASLIKDAPESDKAKLILARLSAISVSELETTNLTKEQKCDLITKHLSAAARRFQTAAWVIIGLAVITSVVTIVAIIKHADVVAAQVLIKEKEKQLQQIRDVTADVTEKLNSLRRAARHLAVNVHQSQRDAVRFEPDNHSLRLLAAQLRRLIKDFEKLQSSHTSLVTDDPLDIRMARAVLEMSEGHFTASASLVTDEDVDVAEFETRVSVLKETRVRVVRGATEFGLRQWNKALIHYKRLHELQPQAVGPLNDMALCHINLRQFDVASEYLEKCLTQLESTAADDSSRRAVLLANLSVSECARGNLKRAHKAIEDALQIRESTASSNRELADCYNNAAGVAWARGELSETKRYAKKAIEAASKDSGISPYTTSLYQRNLANVLRELGEYKPARAAAEASVALEESGSKTRRSSLSESYETLALVHGDLNETSKAIDAMKKAIEIRQLARSDDLDMAKLNGSLALLYYHAGDYENASKLIDLAIKSEERHGETAILSLATHYGTRGVLRSHSNDRSGTLADHQKALDIRQKRLPADHYLIGNSLQNVAFAYFEAGDFSKAAELMQSAETIFQNAYPPSHPQMAILYENQAGIELINGNAAEARRLQESALRIKEHTYGKTAFATVTTRVGLGRIQAMMKDYSDAKETLKGAIEVLKGTAHTDLYVSALKLIAGIEMKNKEYAAAREILEVCMWSEINTKGETPTAAAVLCDIAECDARLDMPDEAREAMSRAVRITQAVFPERHPVYTLVVVFRRGAIEYTLGEEEKGLALVKKSYTFFLATFGEDNVLTKQVSDWVRENCPDKIKLGDGE